MDTPKAKPVMHITVDTQNLRPEYARALTGALHKLCAMYNQQYNVVLSPSGRMSVTTDDDNVARIDLHDEETVKNFIKIMNEESWRKEGSSDAAPEHDHNVAGLG